MDHPSRRRQWPTRLILFGMVLLAALTSPPARRRWPRPARRIQLAIASWVVLVLASATQPPCDLAGCGCAGDRRAAGHRGVVIPRRLARPWPTRCSTDSATTATV